MMIHLYDTFESGLENLQLPQLWVPYTNDILLVNSQRKNVIFLI